MPEIDPAYAQCQTTITKMLPHIRRMISANGEDAAAETVAADLLLSCDPNDKTVPLLIAGAALVALAKTEQAVEARRG